MGFQVPDNGNNQFKKKKRTATLGQNKDLSSAVSDSG